MPFTDFADILDRSRATDAFRADVRAFADHHPAPRVEAGRHSPRVKVLRTIAQLLSAEPGLAVDRVRFDAESGCADFRGTVAVELAGGQERVFDFVWDCQWRAMREGWVDGFGLPDQIRAARTFEWRCFAHWRERPRADALAVEATARGEH